MQSISNIENNTTSSAVVDEMTDEPPITATVKGELNDESQITQTASTAKNEPTAAKLFPGRNLAELTEFLIADNISSQPAIDPAHEDSIAGRGQAELG